MNYIGSKAKLLPFLETTISAVCGETFSEKIFCDLFAGSGVVGEHFAQKGCRVISNDLEYYSYLRNRALLQTTALPNIEDILHTLNALPPKKGLIYDAYCQGGEGGRGYFSDENAQKIDAIRAGIEAYKENEMLYVYLLASLLQSADNVANTASVYSAFLKEIKPLAREPILLEALSYRPSTQIHQVFCDDANALIGQIKGDILYLDPPYNRRQYGANYHLLNTIARYDSFIPKGKTGVRSYQSSLYCKAKTALLALEALMCAADFSYVVLSYNDEGLICNEAIASMMQKYGTYRHFQHQHQRFKAYHSLSQRHSIYEHLHVIEKF